MESYLSAQGYQAAAAKAVYVPVFTVNNKDISNKITLRK